MNKNIHILWFKRDLRVRDNAALYHAAKAGCVLPLYVYEPSLLASPNADAQHLAFINEALFELNETLRERYGVSLYRFHGEMPEVLEALSQHVNIASLYSHEETGELLTYQRDLAVKAWCEKRGVPWHELRQFGVVRRLKSRDTWADKWRSLMQQPVLPPPQKLESIPLEWMPMQMEMLEAQAVYPNITPRPQRQCGGEGLAHDYLETFFNTRGQFYSRHMSSPGTADKSCSRLSPYITYGCISLRTVFQRTKQEQAMAYEKHAPHGRDWFRSLKSFEKRLYWHCHFLQKLEDFPELEARPMQPMYENLRDTDTAARERFEAFKTAQTGVPIIDACLRYCFATGWINFRMRAMLMSFATYQLWLSTQWVGPFLARHFLDYEPGIHYYQAQMQSGETGINPLRIYSPLKQAKDQDPTGDFIRRWVPELAELPLPYLYQPETLPPLLRAGYGGMDYPAPVVALKASYDAAKERLYTLRERPEHRVHVEAILRRHVARTRPN